MGMLSGKPVTPLYLKTSIVWKEKSIWMAQVKGKFSSELLALNRKVLVVTLVKNHSEF